MTPKILKDKSRLTEIYHLRVEAYEGTKYSSFISKQKYPNGLSDELEEQSVHFVIEDKSKIIASARLTKMNKIENLPYHKIFSNIQLPDERPFWFFSKLVVHSDYKGKQLRQKLDYARFNYLDNSNTKTFALMTAKGWRSKELIPKGCPAFGKVNFTLDVSYPYATNEDTFVLIYNIAK